MRGQFKEEAISWAEATVAELRTAHDKVADPSISLLKLFLAEIILA